MTTQLKGCYDEDIGNWLAGGGKRLESFGWLF